MLEKETVSAQKEGQITALKAPTQETAACDCDCEALGCCTSEPVGVTRETPAAAAGC